MEDLAVQVEQAALLGGAGQLGDQTIDPLVFRAQIVEGGHQEGARAAGQVQDLDGPQHLQVIQPDAPAGLVGEGPGATGSMAGLDPGQARGEPAADGAGDDEAGDEVRGVEDAVAFAPGALPVGGLTADGGADGLQVGDGLLEDVAEDVDVEVGLEVVAGQGRDAVQALVGHLEPVEFRVFGEEPTVVAVDLHRRQAPVHRIEQSTELLPARDLDEARGFRRQCLGEDLRGQQAGVLTETDEETAVQQLLGQFQQPVLVCRNPTRVGV